MSSLAVATDLDQTMIYSARAMQLKGYSSELMPDIHPIEFDTDLNPMAYVTAQAYQLLAKLRKNTLFIPTTTRTIKQYCRVDIQPKNQGKDTYAVTSNGGNILVNGKIDEEWAKSVHDILKENSISLKHVQNFVNKHVNESWVDKVRFADDFFMYLVIQREKMPDTVIEDMTLWLAEYGWSLSLQGRKLYFTPDLLTKERAVAEVMERNGKTNLIAAGDSLLDIGLLNLADYAYRPAHGELETANYQHENLIVTEHAGILAGEEILRAMVKHIQDFV